MKTALLLFSALFLSSFAFAQKDAEKTVYKNLEVKRFYSVTTESNVVKGVEVYKGNGKIITKAQFEKFNASRSNMESCKPCMLETYNENEKLVTKAVQYVDCCVGTWTGYYPSGKIRTSGHYRENETGAWDQLWDHGYCIKHGTWTEFAENGKTIKTEKYNFGSLVENK
jgi:antitoxin component YwqK of YwqJK toxin-antitoxin module